MRLLTVNEKRVALALKDYLASQKIAVKLVQNEEGFHLYAENEAQFEQATKEVESFIANPQDPKFWQASWHSGEVQKESVYGDGPLLKTNWWQKGGWVTKSMIFLCSLVYALFLFFSEQVLSYLHYPAGITLVAIDSQWWRLITPIFLHFSLMHFAFNLLWWWELGGLIEKAQSSWRLLGLTVVIALVSNGAQFLNTGADFGGLSAVVYGLLAYVWLYPFADPTAPFRINKVIVWFMLGWLALGFSGVFSTVGLEMANYAHLYGFLVGAVLAISLGLINYKPQQEE